MEPVIAPARVSTASLAVIRREREEHLVEFLVQWNRGWQVLSLVGGHRDDGETDEACLERELIEELFGGVLPDDEQKPFRVGTGKPLRYVAYSDQHLEWTRYELQIFPVELVHAGDGALLQLDACNSANDMCGVPEAVTEWVTQENIEEGWSPMGLPIGETVRRVLRMAGYLATDLEPAF